MNNLVLFFMIFDLTKQLDWSKIKITKKIPTAKFAVGYIFGRGYKN